MWGRGNETVTRLGKEAGYLEALPDLEAALAWARKENASRKVIVWGSSYSSCLVYSCWRRSMPERLRGCCRFHRLNTFRTTRRWYTTRRRKASIPVFITSAKDAEEEEAARSIYDAVADKKDRVLIVPRVGGVHGSSTLRMDRNAGGSGRELGGGAGVFEEILGVAQSGLLPAVVRRCTLLA